MQRYQVASLIITAVQSATYSGMSVIQTSVIRTCQSTEWPSQDSILRALLNEYWSQLLCTKSQLQNEDSTKKHSIVRTADFPDIDKAAFLWFVQEQAAGVPVSGPAVSFRLMEYSELWNIQSYGIFRLMEYSELWNIQNYGIFRVMEYSELWNIQSYGIFRIMEYSELWNIQSYGIFRVMEYSELWNIQNYGQSSVLTHSDN